MNYGHWHYDRCTDCGTEVLTKANGGHDILCEICRAERKRKREKIYNEIRSYKSKKRHQKHATNVLIVVKDPDPIGGFPTNAVLPKNEVLMMTSSVYQSFNEGTILKDVNGITYTVRTLPGGKQKLCINTV